MLVPETVMGSWPADVPSTSVTVAVLPVAPFHEEASVIDVADKLLMVVFSVVVPSLTVTASPTLMGDVVVTVTTADPWVTPAWLY